MSIVKHTGESVIVSSRRCPRKILHIGLKTPSGREDFLVEVYIFLSLVLLGAHGRGEKSGKQMK